MEEIEYWEAVCSRNRAYDGVFVYAVRSTGIYCRPSCPSRRPRREHVQFFGSPAEAEQAGYRACRRCQPEKRTPDEPNLALVQRMCRYLSEPRDQLPTLAELAQEFHLSPYHLQRTFKRIVGVTPRQYAEAQRLERFKAGLKQGESVTDALYEAGYASNSSAYTQAARQFGMTPATYRDWRRRRHLLHRCRISARLAAGGGHRQRGCARSGSVTRPRRWKWSSQANSPPRR